MPPFGPIKKKDLVRCFKQLGFEGPYSGGNHQFMVRADITIRIPNPHQADIGKDLLARILVVSQLGFPHLSRGER